MNLHKSTCFFSSNERYFNIMDLFQLSNILKENPELLCFQLPRLLYSNYIELFKLFAQAKCKLHNLIITCTPLTFIRYPNSNGPTLRVTKSNKESISGLR